MWGGGGEGDEGRCTSGDNYATVFVRMFVFFYIMYIYSTQNQEK